MFLKPTAQNQNHLFHCFASNINGDVLATFRVTFSVSKIQEYTENFVQDLLRAGLTSAMRGKPLEVPQFGQINGIILLGNECVRSLFYCQWSCSCSILCTGTQMSRDKSSYCRLSSVPPTGASGKSFYSIGNDMAGT